MEYEFRKDFITGSPMAKFSYEHEVFGPWLETEVGSGEQIERIWAFVHAIEQQTTDMENRLVGQEYTLTVEFGEVEIKANVDHLDGSLPEELIGDVDDFEQNSQGSCGIDDFILMLKSWQQFNNK